MQAIGTALSRVTSGLSENPRTAQSQPLTVALDWTEVLARTEPMTLAQAKQIASAPLPVLVACSDQHFDKCFRVLLAALPKRNSDDVSGELLIRAYIGKLGGYSDEQISFLCDRVLERCEWFPSIAECLKILAEWKRDDDALRLQERAKSWVFWDLQARFDEAMQALASGDYTQEQINALPTQWKRVAETRGHLWLNDDGSYSARKPGTAPVRHLLEDHTRRDCPICQDVGRVLTLEGEEAPCECAEVRHAA